MPHAAISTSSRPISSRSNTLADLAKKNVDLKQRDVDRKTKLVSSQAGSQADLDTAMAAVVTAQLQAEFAVQQRDYHTEPAAWQS